MKQVIEAQVLEDGTVNAKHEIEILCASCQDPLSDEEKTKNVCSACGAPWQPIQNTTVFATSVAPAVLEISIG